MTLEDMEPLLRQLGTDLVALANELTELKARVATLEIQSHAVRQTAIGAREHANRLDREMHPEPASPPEPSAPPT